MDHIITSDSRSTVENSGTGGGGGGERHGEKIKWDLKLLAFCLRIKFTRTKQSVKDTTCN